MSIPNGELAIPAELHPSGLWIGISVAISGLQTIFMVLDTGSPASAISPTVSRDLRARGLLRESRLPGSYQLTALTADDAARKPPLPDLTVRILPRLDRLEIEGLLGLDFFRLFGHVCFDFPTSSLILSPAPQR
jgi:hypothetical protein